MARKCGTRGCGHLGQHHPAVFSELQGAAEEGREDAQAELHLPRRATDLITAGPFAVAMLGTSCDGSDARGGLRFARSVARRLGVLVRPRRPQRKTDVHLTKVAANHEA